MGTKSIIQSITVVMVPPICFALGGQHNDRIISEIKDVTCEWENGMDFIYHVKDSDGGLIIAIENCPTIVEYKESEESQ